VSTRAPAQASPSGSPACAARAAPARGSPRRPRLWIAVGEVGIGGKREIVATVLLLAPADDHWPSASPGAQYLSASCYDDGGVAAPSSHEGGSKTEADLSVAGLLCCLGCEGGDFRGSNGPRAVARLRKPRPDRSCLRAGTCGPANVGGLPAERRGLRLPASDRDRHDPRHLRPMRALNKEGGAYCPNHARWGATMRFSGGETRAMPPAHSGLCSI